MLMLFADSIPGISITSSAANVIRIVRDTEIQDITLDPATWLPLKTASPSTDPSKPQHMKRDENNGHECHVFRVDEIRKLLSEAGLSDIELHANQWIVPDDKANIPNVGSEAWAFLFEAEIEASRESPGAGTHIMAWGRVPTQLFESSPLVEGGSHT
jgi:hypothetical protein